MKKTEEQIQEIVAHVRSVKNAHVMIAMTAESMLNADVMARRLVEALKPDKAKITRFPMGIEIESWGAKISFHLATQNTERVDCCWRGFEPTMAIVDRHANSHHRMHAAQQLGRRFGSKRRVDNWVFDQWMNPTQWPKPHFYPHGQDL